MINLSYLNRKLGLLMVVAFFVACGSNNNTNTGVKDTVQVDSADVAKDVKSDNQKTEVRQDIIKNDTIDATDVELDQNIRNDNGRDIGPVLDPNRQPVTAVGSDPVRRPYSLHITWLHDPSTSAVMQWQTQDQLAGAVCWIARADEVKTNTDDSVSMPITSGHVFTGQNEKFGLKATNPDQTLHWVEITGLTPGTKYRYRCGEMNIKGSMVTDVNLSPLYSFATPANGDTMNFMVYGDSRGGYEDVATMASYIAKNFKDAEFHIFTGDFDSTGMQNEWDQWFAAMQPITTQWGLIPVMGNHELLTMNNYLGLFVLPKSTGTIDGVDLSEKAFSYDIGPVHIVVLDSNDKKTIKAQVSWLNNDLKATKKPWKVVALHHPAYAAGGHKSDGDVDTYFVPVFEANNVDFVFNGHNHYYERTWPIRDGKKDDTGVVYVTTGGFGAPLYDTESAWFVAYGEKTMNFVNCKVTATQFDMTAYDESGIKIDNYTKNK